MAGFLYRLAVGIKDCGERNRIGWMIRLGLRIRGRIMRMSL
jgi:hypothetical protein